MDGITMPEYGKSTDISRTNIGSKATSSASIKAAQTSIGSNNSVSTQLSSPSRQYSSERRRAIHPGSRAGLNDHKSTYIQANNSGYMNKSNQTARYKNKAPLNKPNVKAISAKAGCVPKMFDGRLTTSPLSSISRLSKLIG